LQQVLQKKEGMREKEKEEEGVSYWRGVSKIFLMH